MSTMDAKHGASHIETVLREDGTNNLSNDKDLSVEQEKQHIADPDLPEDPAVARRILRKLDIRLLPILGALYTICLIDRTNLGVARISGLDEATDLKVGNRASVAILVFYCGYVVFELPSNIVLKKVGPARWLSFLGLAWGLVELGMGFIKNWYSLAILRIFLGIFEAGVFPGCVYLISSWYKRFEVQKRIAVFFLSASLLSAFSNIFAYGLIQAADNPRIDGWKWIFIIEGTITVVIAIIAYVVVIDFPGSKRVRFLNSEEQQFVINRLREVGGADTEQRVNWKLIKETVSDWRILSISFMYQTGSTGTYGFLLFLPIILQNSLGFSQQNAFILSAPPAVFAVLFAYGISWYADRTRVRGPFMLLASIFSIVGLAMIGFLDAPVPRYIGAFIGEAGTNSMIVTGLAWGQNNIRGDAKRSVASALQITFAAIGGIYSALVFRQQDAPRYIPGIIATGAMALLSAVMAPITSLLLHRANKQADAGQRTIENTPGYRYTW